MPDLYPMPPFLAPGQSWPPTNMHGVNYQDVFQAIRDNRELFRGDHQRVFAEQYKRLQPAALGDATENRDPVTMQELLIRLAAARGRTAYQQEIDLPQALSLLWADLNASRAPRITAGTLAVTTGATSDNPDAAKPGDAEQAALQRLTTDIISEIHEAYVEQSYAGDGVFVARWTKAGGGQVVAYPADQVIAWSATGDPKAPTCYVLFTEQPETPLQTAPDSPTAAQGLPTILSVEIHYRGLVRYRRYKVAGGRIIANVTPVLPDGTDADQQLNGVTEFLVQPFKNFGTAKDWRGISDYNAIETLVAEFDVRSSQWGRLNDKFTAPTMKGPASLLRQDEDTGHWVYRTSPDGKFLPMEADDPEPGYLVWDPKFEMQRETWDRLLDMFYTVSGTTPAAFSMFKDGGGGQLSGIALRLRMARPLQVAGRKRERCEPALRRALLAAQQLEVSLGKAQYRPTLPVFGWSDGLPTDPKEQADTESTRKGAGLTSTKASLMRLDGLSESEAEQELVEIQAEQAAAMPVIPGTGGSADLNGPDGPQILQRARQIQADHPGMTEQQAIDQARAELQKRSPPGAQG